MSMRLKPEDALKGIILRVCLKYMFPCVSCLCVCLSLCLCPSVYWWVSIIAMKLLWLTLTK